MNAAAKLYCPEGKTQVLLSKNRLFRRRLAYSGELKPHSFDDASLSDIIRLAQQDDAAAFEVIYRRYSARVYAVCLRMVHDPLEAEDLAQEAFMQVFRKLSAFRGESA
jgi:hypothetical protein